MAQVTVNQAAHKDFRWNFSVNVLDIVFIVLGFSLISRDTVMPTLVSELTDSKLAIGLIPAYRIYRYSLADGMTIRV